MRITKDFPGLTEDRNGFHYEGSIETVEGIDIDLAGRLFNVTGSIYSGGGVKTESFIVSGLTIEAVKDITAGGIIAGGDIKAGLNIRSGGDIQTFGNITAEQSIVAVINIAGRDIKAGYDIRANGNISAEGDIEAGMGINAGLSIRCCGLLKSPLHIFAGTCVWHKARGENMVVEAKRIEGEVKYGTVRLLPEA